MPLLDVLRLPSSCLALCAILSVHWAAPAAATNPFVQYAVDFPNPDAVAARNFSSRFNGAEASIVAWAEEMASHGPWSVTFKPVLAPSGDKHDYMSWAPYEWPNCTALGNKTVLTDEEVWRECPYVFRDGQVNPDRTLPDDFQSFFNLSDAVLYGAIASTFGTQNGASSVHSQNVVRFINTWFLDADTAMNPNLLYAQMNRGPGGQLGTFTGILDLRGFAKIAAGVLVLRKSSNADWTPALDAQLVAWCMRYIGWLESAPTARQAAASTNNHGTLFVNQLAALKLLVGDAAGAANWTQNYFAGIFQGQLSADGDQPMEAARTRPWHYRNFNLAGMITNARLLSYAAPSARSPWTATAHGATIQTALDFLTRTDPAASGEADVAAEVFPNVLAVAAAYGDAQYTGYLVQRGFAYADEPAFLWDQPLAGGDALASASATRGAQSQPTQGAGVPVRRGVARAGVLGAVVVGLVAAWV